MSITPVLKMEVAVEHLAPAATGVGSSQATMDAIGKTKVVAEELIGAFTERNKEFLLEINELEKRLGLLNEEKDLRLASSRSYQQKVQSAHAAMAVLTSESEAIAAVRMPEPSVSGAGISTTLVEGAVETSVPPGVADPYKIDVMSDSLNELMKMVDKVRKSATFLSSRLDEETSKILATQATIVSAQSRTRVAEAGISAAEIAIRTRDTAIKSARDRVQIATQRQLAADQKRKAVELNEAALNQAGSDAYNRVRQADYALKVAVTRSPAAYKIAHEILPWGANGVYFMSNMDQQTWFHSTFHGR